MADSSEVIPDEEPRAVPADAYAALPRPDGPAPSGRVADLSVLLAFAVLVFLPRLSPPWNIDHDVAWYNYAAARVLDGGTLYVDVIDLNPPLIVYLHMPPVLLARALGCAEIPTLMAYISFVVLISLGLSYWVLRRWDCFDSQIFRRLFFLGLMIALVAVPGLAFGQREHLMLVMLVPYVLAAGGRAAGVQFPRLLMLVIGLWAGVGLALKPYFLLAPVAVQAYLVFGPVGRRVLRSPENLGLAAVVGLYALHFLFLPSDMRIGFWNTVRMARETYGAYTEPWTVIAAQGHVLMCLLLLVAYALVGSSVTLRHLARVLVLASAALLLAALWQQKGWPYHFLPALVFGWLTAAVLAIGIVQREELLRLMFRPGPKSLALILTGGLFLAAGVIDVRHFRSPPMGGIAPIVKKTSREADGEPIMAFSTSVYPMFPLVNFTGLPWSSRFNCLWLLPGVYADVDGVTSPFPYHPSDQMHPIERYVIDCVVQDMTSRPPRLVFVQYPPRHAMPNDSFDFITCLSRDPEFARLWRQYRSAAQFLGHRVFKRFD
ncbi:MAG: hypothetical protein JSU68_10945 [Phycisphaerales bacterium]|nr:MAG: hypothetical protein JSU68_10945 [Phycisphaerales bacterium]